MPNPPKRFLCDSIAGFTLLAFLLTQPAWPLPASTHDALRQEPPTQNRSGLEELKTKLQPPAELLLVSTGLEEEKIDRRIARLLSSTNREKPEPYPLTKEEAFEQMALFETSRKNVPYRDGRMLDFRGKLPKEMEEIWFVGDLHAQWKHLANVLRDPGNLGKLQQGRALLLILGDAEHPETVDGFRSADMTDSIATVQLILDLMIRYPNAVSYILGNHTLLWAHYRRALEIRYGEEYIQPYKQKFLQSLPVGLIGDGFVAFHGKPPENLTGTPEEIVGRLKGVTYEELLKGPRSYLIFSLLWSSLAEEDPASASRQAKKFLEAVGQPDGILVGGHVHKEVLEKEAHQYSPFYLIYSGVNVPGGRYLVYSPSDRSVKYRTPTANPAPGETVPGSDENNAGLEELEAKLRGEEKTTFRLLSEIVRRPINVDWEKEKIPPLQGRSLGVTNTAGRFDFYPVPRFAFAWPALGFKGAGWEGVIQRVEVKWNFLELTVEFSKGNESFSRVFQVGKTTRQVFGLGKLKGQTLTVLDLDPAPGVRFLRDIITDPVGFKWKVMTGNLPDLRGARLGQTNTAGRIDIGLSQRMVYPWTVLGHPEEGWEAVIVDQKTVGEILEFTVLLTKDSKKIRRKFQIHSDFTQERMPPEQDRLKHGPITITILEIGGSLGVKALSHLILQPSDFNWTREAKKFPNLAGLRLGETNAQGSIAFSPIPNFMFQWGVLGFNQRGWEAVITESGVRHGRYEFSVRLSKGKRSIHKTFQIGRFTRFLPGQGAMEGTPPKEVLDIDDRLGLQTVSKLVTGGLTVESSSDLSFLEGLRLGTTAAEGQLRFRPFPYYRYTWTVLGSKQAGWEAVISAAQWHNGHAQLTVKLTKDTEVPRYRTFQVGPFQRLLTRFDRQNRTPSAARRKVFRIIHLQTVIGLVDPLGNGVRKSSYDFRTQQVEAIDPSADVSRQAESSEFLGQFGRILETLPEHDREIAEQFLDGEGVDAIVNSNGFTRDEVLRIRGLLQTELSHFIPDNVFGKKDIAVSVAVAEAAVTQSRAVVLDAVGLEEFPGLVPILQQLGSRFSRKIILFGKSDIAEEAAHRTGIQYVPERSPDSVAAVLGRMSGLEEVTSLGPPNLAEPIRIAAGARGLRFVQQQLSMKSFLIGLGTSEKLASDLATGLEEAVGLGREA